jgi:hypothetical protein
VSFVSSIVWPQPDFRYIVTINQKLNRRLQFRLHQDPPCSLDIPSCATNRPSASATTRLSLTTWLSDFRRATSRTLYALRQNDALATESRRKCISDSMMLSSRQSACGSPQCSRVGLNVTGTNDGACAQLIIILHDYVVRSDWYDMETHQCSSSACREKIK